MRLVQCLLLLCGLLVCPTLAFAQATYFDVPSAEAPEPGQTITQVQLGVGKELDLSGLTVVGLGHGAEVGLTVYNVDWERTGGDYVFADNARDHGEPFAPLALFSTQKVFHAHERDVFSLGAQVGTNIAHRGEQELIARAYLLAVLDLESWGRCSAGPYVASQTMLGDHQRFAGFAGCDIALVPERIDVVLEWDAGAHALGKVSLGPRLLLASWLALSVGAQIPNAWGSADYRGLAQLELTTP